MTQPIIFCDFDGPIVDVSDRYYATYRQGLQLVEQQGLARAQPIAVRPISKAQFWTFKQNRIPDRQIAHWSGLEGHQIDDFLAQVNHIVNHPSLLRHDQVQAQAREALAMFQQCGVRLVLVTLRCPDQVRGFLSQNNLEGGVSELFGMPRTDAAYTNQAHHKVERLQTAMVAQQRQGYSVKNAWMIGDTEADIMAGQTLGLETVALTCGIRSRNYLQGFRPTCLMPDLWAAAQRLQRQVTLRLR